MVRKQFKLVFMSNGRRQTRYFPTAEEAEEYGQKNMPEWATQYNVYDSDCRIVLPPQQKLAA